MSTTLTYSNDNIYETGNYSATSFLKTPPNMPLYDSTGAPYNIPNNTYISNPLYALNQYSTNSTDNFIGNTKLSYLLLPNLKASVNVGYNKVTQNGYRAYPTNSLPPDYYYGQTNLAYFTNNSVATFVTEPQLDYNTHIGKGKLQALLGGTWQQNETYLSFIEASNFSSDALIQNLAAASTINVKGTGSTEYKYESVFLRGTYNWQDKYIVNGSFRRDGSSRFGDGYKFGNFWSAGGAWIFSNENFLKNRGSFRITENLGEVMALQEMTRSGITNTCLSIQQPVILITALQVFIHLRLLTITIAGKRPIKPILV